jgi:hypothetical protein
MNPDAAEYQRVTLLRPAEYARERFESGATVTVDAVTAGGWIKAGIASPSADVPAIWTNCPRCRASWTIPAVPEAGAYWVQCPRCGRGWMR